MAPNTNTNHMGSSVHVKDSVVVTPSEPTPNCVLPLSPIDSQLLLRLTTEFILVYKLESSLDQAFTVSRLKSALAKAMVPYYPFAGRVRPRVDSLGLEVLCQAQGAVFIEASSDHYVVIDFERGPKTTMEWRALLSLDVPDVLDGSPPLVVQLTWLRDSTAVVSVGMSHCICDGTGSSYFLNYFTELASGKDVDPKPKPVWDRHLLNPPPIKSMDRVIIPEFERVRDLCGFVNRITNGIKPTSIVLNKRRINELKNIARCTSQLSDSSYTSFEVVATHVWRSWARALGFPPNQNLKLLFAVDVRNRVKPGIPEGYYGNMIVLGCAESSAGELMERGVGFGSDLVKRAKERVDNEHVRKVSELVSELNVSPDSVGVLIMSQWSKLGFDRVDFGMGMGKPVFVGSICCDRFCLLLPVKDQMESVRVALPVPTAAVDNYHRFIDELHDGIK